MLFTYFSPTGVAFPLQPHFHEERQEFVFQVRQIYAALGYKAAADLSAKGHPRNHVKAAFPDPSTGVLSRPMKAVTRHGIKYVTPISDTEAADHFDNWMRDVVLKTLDHKGGIDDAVQAQHELDYLRKELACVEAEHAKTESDLRARIDDAQSRCRVAPVPSEPAQPAAAPEPVKKAYGEFTMTAEDIERGLRVTPASKEEYTRRKAEFLHEKENRQ
jgi:prophage antirepressor-like protein